MRALPPFHDRRDPGGGEGCERGGSRRNCGERLAWKRRELVDRRVSEGCSDCARVALNGNAVTEGEYNAAYAGAKGVPVIFASGDDAAVAEIKSHLGNIEIVETKKSLSFHSAETLTPAASCDKIFAGVKSALARLHEFKPYVIKTPVTLEITFKNYTPAELLSYLRSVERVDSHTIRFVGRDMDEVDDFEEFVANYNSDSAP